jgi:hypothetical protein
VRNRRGALISFTNWKSIALHGLFSFCAKTFSESAGFILSISIVGSRYSLRLRTSRKCFPIFVVRRKKKTSRRKCFHP